MEILKNLFKKNGEQGDQQNANAPVDPQEESQENEEVTAGTKIKVVAALAIVAFAGYVAYWIQEPVDIRADLLNSSSMQSQQANTQEVAMVNFAFSPATVNVQKGTTVLWTNKDTVPHNVVSDSFTSPTLNPGESFSHTFDADGSFAYRCTFHPQMKGFVLVGSQAGATQAATQDILSGFGAGSSLALESSAPSEPAASGSQENASAQSQEEAIASELTTEEPAAEPSVHEELFTSSAPAPADALHNAALQSIGATIGNLNNLNSSVQGSEKTAAENQKIVAAQEAQMNAAQSQTKGKLASSGPEDIVYAGMFGVIMYLNRRKLRKFQKNLR